MFYKKTGTNFGCMLITAVCHIKNNTSLSLYQHYFYFDSRSISKLFGQLSLAYIFYLLSSNYKNNVFNIFFNKFYLHVD